MGEWAERVGRGELDARALRALGVALDGAHWLALNMNDTFAYATADAEYMPVEDLAPMLPVLAEYGHDALTAYAALRRGAEPIRRLRERQGYLAARAEVETLRAADPDFGLRG